jgi:hypothetical protein
MWEMEDGAIVMFCWWVNEYYILEVCGESSMPRPFAKASPRPLTCFVLARGSQHPSCSTTSSRSAQFSLSPDHIQSMIQDILYALSSSRTNFQGAANARLYHHGLLEQPFARWPAPITPQSFQPCPFTNAGIAVEHFAQAPAALIQYPIHSCHSCTSARLYLSLFPSL